MILSVKYIFHWFHYIKMAPIVSFSPPSTGKWTFISNCFFHRVRLTEYTG